MWAGVFPPTHRAVAAVTVIALAAFAGPRAGRAPALHSDGALVVGGDAYALEQQLHGAELVAKGRTHFHVFMIPVCSAVLYLEPRTPNQAVLSDVPKVLELSYHRSISAAEFAGSTTATIERNGLLSAHVRPLVERFNTLYANVRAGDRYQLSYHPRHGVSIRLNGELLGSVGWRDPEFAKALFSVWFGARAFHPTFRHDLMLPIQAHGHHARSRDSAGARAPGKQRRAAAAAAATRRRDEHGAAASSAPRLPGTTLRAPVTWASALRQIFMDTLGLATPVAGRVHAPV